MFEKKKTKTQFLEARRKKVGFGGFQTLSSQVPVLTSLTRHTLVAGFWQAEMTLEKARCDEISWWPAFVVFFLEFRAFLEVFWWFWRSVLAFSGFAQNRVHPPTNGTCTCFLISYPFTPTSIVSTQTHRPFKKKMIKKEIYQKPPAVSQQKPPTEPPSSLESPEASVPQLVASLRRAMSKGLFPFSALLTIYDLWVYISS